MNVKDFVKETIIGISEAIIEINDEKRNTGLKACPITLRGIGKSFAKDDLGTNIMDVDFDLCVEVSDTTTAEAGLKISIAKAGVDNNTKNSTTSHIRFTIPVAFPPSNYNINRQT